IPNKMGVVMTRKRIDRRTFLHGAGVTTLAFAQLGTAGAREPASRSLSFIHTHTGEGLTELYFREGVYQTASLERINTLLRDFRTAEVHPMDPRVLDILFDLQTLANRDEPYQI